MTETFINENEIEDILDDRRTLPGYSIIHKPRKKTHNRNSGGLCIIVKNDIRHHVEYVYNESITSLWCKVTHQIDNQRNSTYIGCVYIPPEGSIYSCKGSFAELENDLVYFSSLSKNIIVCGDFNSYTNNSIDFIEPQPNENFNPVPENICETTEAALTARGLPLLRTSNDQRPTNTWGKLFLNCLKNSNLLICNGRFGQSSSSYTTVNNSVIDYFICSPDIVNAITHMYVCDFNPVLSDVHCSLSMKLNLKVRMSVQQTKSITKNIEDKVKVGKWDADKTTLFCENLDKDKIHEINESILDLDTMENKLPGINNVMNDIASLFINTGIDTFGKRTNQRKKNKKSFPPDSKPWYNVTCRNKRMIFNRARKKFQITKSTRDLENVKEIGKQYKNELIKAHRTHADEVRAKIRLFRRNRNKKCFWNYCKTKPSANNQDDLDFEKFTQFFKDLNSNAQNNNASQHGVNERIPNARLDTKITATEIKTAINRLKNNKACGPDDILNEYLKSSIEIMLPTYVLLFNFVYNHGIVPESWSSGIIKPVYKNKGSMHDPDNFRPITILSCMGKAYTSVLNSRLSDYVNDANLIGEDQLGFRAGYSTIDGIFILNSLQALLKHRNKSLFCAFIDLKKCFPSIWRDGLWFKLSKLNLGIKMTRTIQAIYQNIKSSVRMTTRNQDGSLASHVSDWFPCQNGLREGENLSPLLFSLYVNDLTEFMQEANCEGVKLSSNTENELIIFFKIILLMYADDTVIFAHKKKDLQKSLNVYAQYCHRWKLTINTQKTKIICFGRKKKCKFFINNEEIEIVDNFKYLGVTLNRNGRLINALKENIQKATKGLHSLRASFRDKYIPIDCQLEICEKTIEPILLYGCEIWGFENLAILEQFQIKYVKQILGLRQNTPNYMVLGESGKIPLAVQVKSRMIMFWQKLISGNQNKLSYQLYRFMLSDMINSNAEYNWLSTIKNVLTETGNYGAWLHQILSESDAKRIKQTLCDQAQQSVFSDCRISNKGRAYATFKQKLTIEPFVSLLNNQKTLALMKFRTSNHRLPVETGRYVDIAYEDRKCPFCINSLGDEFHYLFECTKFKNDRRNFLKPVLYNKPNMMKFISLMQSTNLSELEKLSTFATIIMKSFR